MVVYSWTKRFLSCNILFPFPITFCWSQWGRGVLSSLGKDCLFVYSIASSTLSVIQNQTLSAFASVVKYSLSRIHFKRKLYQCGILLGMEVNLPASILLWMPMYHCWHCNSWQSPLKLYGRQKDRESQPQSVSLTQLYGSKSNTDYQQDQLVCS